MNQGDYTHECLLAVSESETLKLATHEAAKTLAGKYVDAVKARVLDDTRRHHPGCFLIGSDTKFEAEELVKLFEVYFTKSVRTELRHTEWVQFVGFGNMRGGGHGPRKKEPQNQENPNVAKRNKVDFEAKDYFHDYH